MRKGFLGSLVALAGGASLTLAQSAATTLPAVTPRPALLTADAAPAKPVPAQVLPVSGCGAEGCSVGTCCMEEACAVPDEACGPAGRFWFSGEYLLWWTKGSSLPPLVTTGPTAAAIPGALVPGTGTTVLFGGDNTILDRGGARFTGGFWLNDCHTVGIEGSYFFLAPRDRGFVAGGPTIAGAPVLSRPFFNLGTGAPDVELVSFPGLAGGTVRVNSNTRLQGEEINGIFNVCCGCDYRLDVLAGFRMMQLDEGLSITEDLNVSPTSPLFPGNRIQVADQFGTHNTFYGGQVGARGEYRIGRAFVDLLGKVALGDTREVLDVNGSTVRTTPAGATIVNNGGLLALSSNSGHFTRDRFSVLPEATINVGYQVTDHVRAYAGYTFLYWSNVVRPGDQIDTTLNPNLISTSTTFGAGGPARPAPLFRDTDFWAQGINLGVEIRY